VQPSATRAADGGAGAEWDYDYDYQQDWNFGGARRGMVAWAVKVGFMDFFSARSACDRAWAPARSSHLTARVFNHGEIVVSRPGKGFLVEATFC
jgi:hypothetical protein